MVGCWPPSRSRGSGLFLSVDGCPEEVSICGRQRLRPHGHRLHMNLERVSLLKGVFYGVVERCLGHEGLVALLLEEAPRLFLSPSGSLDTSCQLHATDSDSLDMLEEEPRVSCVVTDVPEDLCPGAHVRPLQFAHFFLQSAYCASQPAHRAPYATIAPNHPIRTVSRPLVVNEWCRVYLVPVLE